MLGFRSVFIPKVIFQKNGASYLYHWSFYLQYIFLMKKANYLAKTPIFIFKKIMSEGEDIFPLTRFPS